MRFHPGPATVHELIEGNRIGDLVAMRIETGSYLPGWRKGQDYARSYSASAEWGGAILDCIHEIDLALWYGGPAKLEAARWTMANSIGLNTDGLAELILRHENGVLTNVHLNFIQRDYRRACQVIGTRGTIYWDFGKGCVDLYDEQGLLTDSFPQQSSWSMNEMYLDELSYFMKCVESNSLTSNAIAEAIATLKIAVDARSPINRAA
ncbi:MAG TPA: Gfo/Idh/MocA family oxidoreductase [Pyrinomonadaceae bacterium]|nr:Gfo/Idh/MocA family oxidoreductase [Pyrinomonadaceae bacterium]